MRDIKPQIHHSEAVPLSPQPRIPTKAPQRSQSLVLWVEKTIEATSRLGEKLALVLQPNKGQEIILPPLQSPPLQDTPKPHPKKARPVTLSKIQEKGRVTGHKLKHATKRTRRHLKTPLGKIAIAQTIAVLALFGYVQTLAQRGPGVSLQADQPSENEQTGVLRKFLPSISQYVEPKPFETNELQNPNSPVPLHAWLTPWNLTELQQTQERYASVSAFWLTVQSDGFSMEPKADWRQWDEFRKQTKKPGQTYFLTVSGNPNYTYLALTQPEIQAKHIENLLRIVEEHGFDGIDIDYEGLGSENRNIFTEFIGNLATVFHAKDKKVGVTVEARIANQVPMDWKALSDQVDEVRIMVYDYHSKNTGTPGPVAPIGWLKEVLDYTQATIDPRKLVIGLGNYGYDWTEKAEGEGWEGIGISFDQAMALSKERQAPIIRVTGIDDRGYDMGSIPAFTYKDGEEQHSVWFEDKESLQTKVQLVSQYKTAGVIFWSVGMGDKEFWEGSTPGL